MPKKSKKSLSKRVKLKDKFKIARKVKEHHKKQRKEAKKQEKKKPSVLKDPGIPANYPYREQVIKELQFEHQRIVAQRAEKRKAAQERRQARKEGQNDEDMEDDGADPLQQLAAIREAAEERQSQFEDEQNNPEAKGDGGRIGKGNAYYDGFKKVVDSSDVILQVLDARDPCSCRCLEVERYVRKVDPNKRIVVILNKIDLVPPEIVRKWLIYLREELPAVAFKAATKKKGTIKQIRMPQHSSAARQSNDLETSECLGADTLMQLLKNYSRSNDVKSVISVGVVGLPNVGKSSVINSLKRSNVVHTGNVPGITKSVQEIHLDKHIRLLDSPGLVTSTADNPAAEALYGGVKIEKAQEPVAAVASILERISSQLLMSVYNIAEFTDCESMLRQVAVARGRLRKGGTADLLAAARLVLSDWRDGHIPFHTLPPGRGNEKHETVTVVDGSSSGIDMRALLGLEEQQVLAKLQHDEDMDE